ncbi:MAG: DUF5605 domain-containing protein [Planctomycetales bacterium]|nr:DUF5605 domain-containing protein [Planctomycetales bacterium]
MVHRFWECVIGGTYPGHGECYLDPNDVLWWAKGGELHGRSPARIAFLKQIVGSRPAAGIDNIDKWQYTNIAGQAGQYYLVYFGRQQPSSWTFALPKHELRNGQRFRVDVIDTWNMTATPVDTTFTVRQSSQYQFADEQGGSVALPGRPWIALRIVETPQD